MEGDPTFFVEKIWMSLIQSGQISLGRAIELSQQTGIGSFDMNNIRKFNAGCKHHTIRAGRRFKDGELASLRVWSDKAYRSPQIAIAHADIPVRVFDFEIDHGTGVMSINGTYTFEYEGFEDGDELLAANDGLSYYELQQWFRPAYMKADFIGQIICWNPELEYNLRP